ncbi:hypothetical protein HYPSUDRAFT_140502, partial [Hypholoma sublateritium FD-334 SS-4]
ALQAYTRRPDCFKRAAGAVRARCATLDMDEAERVDAAISMTLCEIATAAHHAAPLECRAYTTHGNRGAGEGLSSKVRGECVSALSRSAQFWASYSGYLREVPQLCHAFRRWNDIDLARDIYRNATLEKITFLRSAGEREREMARQMERWAGVSTVRCGLKCCSLVR